MGAATVLIPLSWRGVVEVTGRDRTRFLHGMCTNDIKALKPGEGCLAAVVTRQGKMVAEIVVRALEESLLLEIDRSNLDPLVQGLSKFLVADDVAFRTTELSVVGLYGPEAGRFLEVDIPKPYHFARREGVLISRVPLPGYDLILPPSRQDEVERLRSKGAVVADEATFEAFRIENGFPRWGIDMDGEVLPMEAGLEPLAISYSKGCYIGQEVIQRVKTYSEPPQALVQLELEGAAAPGAKISAGGAEIGRVTSAAGKFALGYVRKEHKAPGTRVVIFPGTSATVRALPWRARP